MRKGHKEEEKEKKYQKNLVKIPKPEFIVLYNGVDDYPDYSELKLSDAFMDIEGLITPVIEYGIKNNILKEYLEAHASEAHDYARRSRVDE